MLGRQELTSDEMLQRLQREIEDLQSRLAFQEQTLTTLDEVISGQDQLLLKQQRQLHLLGEKLKMLEGRVEQDGAPTIDKPPPHY